MGGGISSNFTLIHDDFMFDCWKVIRASHKTSGQIVSLWKCDPDKLKIKYSSKTDRIKYLTTFSDHIIKSRKLVHPHILKIYDYQTDNNSYFEFTSEPLKVDLKSQVGQLTSIEAQYISYQILDVLKFIHKNYFVHFGISTDAFFITDDSNIKLFNFAWISPMNSIDEIVHPPFSEFLIGPNFPNINYTSPEIVIGRQCSTSTDLFSFALVYYEILQGEQLFKYTKKDEYKMTVTLPPPNQNTINNKNISNNGMNNNNQTNNENRNVNNLSKRSRELIRECLQTTPALRPLLDDLIHNSEFSSIHTKVLHYFDNILIKESKDKFEFFKKFSNVINDFRHEIIKEKFLPIMVDQSLESIEISPVILPIIFQAADKVCTIKEFTKIYLDLSSLVNLLNPPEILVAFLYCLEIILINTDPAIHEVKVYHIISNALKSNIYMHQYEVLKRFSSLISKLSLTGIENYFLPLLCRLCDRSTDVNLISMTITSMTGCMMRADHDKFMSNQMLKLAVIFEKFNSPILVQPIINLIIVLNGKIENIMEFVIPVASVVLFNDSCHHYYKKQLCEWIESQIYTFIYERKLQTIDEPNEDSEEKKEINIDELIYDDLSQKLGIGEITEFDYENIDFSCKNEIIQNEEFVIPHQDSDDVEKIKK